MKRTLSRLLHLPRSADRIRDDIDDEIRFDIEMRARDLMREGLSAESARERAVAEFGDLDATRRYCAEVDMEMEADRRRGNMISDLHDDLRLAGRAMRRAPLFAFVVVGTLAMGIGANTTIFSIVRRVLIAPLPYRDPSALYRLYTVPSAAGADDDKLSAVELDELANQSRLLAGLTQFGSYGGLTYTDGRTAESWQTAQVAPNFFNVLGIAPALGRAFSSDDIAPGAARTVILAAGLWRRVFGADPSVVGRRIRLNDVDYLVIGVLPATFVGPTFTADALLPLNTTAIARSARMSRARAWRAVARLREGVTPQAFATEIALLRSQVQARYPEIGNAGMIRPVPLHDAMVRGAKGILLLVMSAAALLLVIACVNIAGLFLSRATRRRRELSLRVALGAGRGRLIRQLLSESLMYGLAGGVAAAMLTVAMKRLVLAAAATSLPHLGEVRIDTVVLGFTAGVSIVCGLAFGLAPALLATRGDPREALADAGSRTASRGRADVRGSRTLVALQIAFGVVLVVGASLLTRTFIRLMRTDLGYAATDRALAFHVNLPFARYSEVESRLGLIESLIERVRAMPDVKAVGYTAVSPWNGGLMSVRVRVDGRAIDDQTLPSVQYATASDEFLSATGIPLRAGRGFTANDRIGSPPVLIVSESVARRFWPGTTAIGGRVRLSGARSTDSSAVFEVIGVVGDVRPSLTDDPIATIYVSERQWVGYGGEFVVRTAASASALVPPIAQALRELDPNLPLIWPRTLRQVVENAASRQQLAMTLMGVFAVLALVLSALGVYSVMAYAVAARAREFGIRSALGARRGIILGLVLRDGLSTAVIGVVGGVVLAALASKLIASLLVGVSAHDAVTFALAPAVLLIVATFACLLPAVTATRVPPVDALRTD